MLSKGSNNFATKVISTENVEKIVKEVRKKNQTYFFLSFKATSLKVTISGKILYLKNLNKGSSSSWAIYKFILECITWVRLHMHI